MRKTSAFLLLIIVLASIPIAAQNLLDGPEGVVFDSVHNRYLVSNWNDGAIVAVDTQGNQTYFTQALAFSANMYILDTILYVCCNNRWLVGVHLTTAEVVSFLTLETSGFHDLVFANGYFYATDWDTDRIFKIDPVAQTYTTFVGTGLSYPFGIEYDADNDRLIICSFWNAAVQEVDISTGTVSTLTFTSYNNDDLAFDKHGSIYLSSFSSWNGGEIFVFRYNEDFSGTPELIMTEDGILVDICYNHRDNVLAVTNSELNTVQFFHFDTDGDEILDHQDNCESVYNPLQEDLDSDMIGDSCDNCLMVYNPDQLDEDQNDIGDACEGCCLGFTGNVNCSEEEQPDISDITRLIDFLYISHADLCCEEEADSNGSGGTPDISDITRLIDHLYLSQSLLPDCP
ncbi:MAG: DUF6923 family protein [Candidatus Zixiibacteriota bacterium]